MVKLILSLIISILTGLVFVANLEVDNYCCIEVSKLCFMLDMFALNFLEMVSKYLQSPQKDLAK